MDIIMIRHGESEANVSGVFGTEEAPLTKQGRKQIEDTRENLKGFSFDKVYYSPFTRTVETLKILGLDGRADERIAEYNFGIFSGKTHYDLEGEFPREYKEWIEDPTGYRIPGGESLRLAYDRVKGFLEEALTKDENLLLVTHAGVIRLALCWVFDDVDYFFKFKVDNGSINIISIDDGYKFIRMLNYRPGL